MIKLLNPVTPIKNYFSSRQQARIFEENRQKTIDDILTVGIIRESVEGYLEEDFLGRVANMPDSKRRAIVYSLLAKRENYKLSMLVHEECWNQRADESMKYLAQRYAVQKLENKIIPIYRKLFPSAFERAA